MSVQLNPEVWPACSQHSTAYVLRRAFSLNGPSRWIWQSDCKKSCKAEPELRNAGGEVKP